VHHASGSHKVLKHPDKPHLRVTVPYHNKDLKRGTLAAILAQAGLSPEEFVELL
jgi:predicted RNA binding protein YcfA (HicA-like mRNA interferase family)